MADIKDIYRQFKKAELLDVLDELSMKLPATTTTRNMAQAIVDDINTNGVPEPDSVSDILYEFLVVAEFYDEEGNILEIEEENEESEEVDLEDIPDWMCFTYADSRDPACNKCKLFDACLTARVSNRPECFGMLYNENEPECQVCIEAPYCKKEMNNG